MLSRSRRTYDHRIKEQIARTGNPDLFPELEIPRLCSALEPRAAGNVQG
ncbi:MAG: hypothetical protein U0263_35300 [Polyangiaceae bacterium]